MSQIQSVCVFCGSSPGARPEYIEAARRTGLEIARRGLTLVYGAGNIGLMGALADAALEAGGRVIGAIPQSPFDWEVAHAGLSELKVVASMHERKAWMSDRADAFIALPGGMGTWEELFEILTWAQLGIHHKPVGLLNIAGFYDPLIALFDTGVRERFVRSEHRALLLCHPSDPGSLLDELTDWQPVSFGKYLDRDEV